MPIFAFKCDSCEVDREVITKYGVEEVPCECGGTSRKQPSYKSVALGLPNGHIGIRNNGGVRLKEFKEPKI